MPNAIPVARENVFFRVHIQEETVSLKETEVSVMIVCHSRRHHIAQGASKAPNDLLQTICLEMLSNMLQGHDRVKGRCHIRS